MKYTTADIQRLVRGKLIGSSELKIEGANRIEFAQDGEITFLANQRYAEHLADSKASCIIVPEGVEEQLPVFKNRAYIAVDQPYRAFVQVLKKFAPPAFKRYFRHPSAIIAESANVAKNSYIGPNCIIGENCVVADGAILKANVTLYDDVFVGGGTIIHANVTCYDDTKIGRNCIIHSGAVLGSDGFGNLENEDGSWEKIPQLGNVVLGDEVEVGANTTIDCATLGSTIIEDGVKLDNLIHIAHNVTVGKHTAMAAQVGISGSAVIGSRNRIGGQVGIVGHISIADDVVILAQSGVAREIKQEGQYFGTPAVEARTAFRREAALKQLPELLKEFRDVKNRIEELLKEKE